MASASRSPEGLDWATYFARYREGLKRAQEPQEADEDPIAAVEVLIPGHDLQEPEKAPGAPGRYAKRLLAAGWEVRVRTSRVHVPAVLFKDGNDNHEAGDVRYAAHDLDTYCLLGVKRGGGQLMAVDATWSGKVGKSLAFQIARTYDPILGFEIRRGARTPRKPNPIEIEDGIEPPMALDDWLNIVAPKPEPKRKGK